MLKVTIEITGWVAASLLLSAYLLLTMGKITGRSGLYQWLNVLSGAGFILNSGWNDAYPSACINVALQSANKGANPPPGVLKLVVCPW